MFIYVKPNYFFNISLISNMSEKQFLVSLCMWIDHSLLIMKNKRRRKGLKLLEYKRPSASYPDTCHFSRKSILARFLLSHR